MPTKTDNQVIYGVIQAMIAANPTVSNSDMAEEATRRLGKPVTRSDISRLRGDIGLNMYQMSEKSAARAVQLAVLEIVEPILCPNELVEAAIAAVKFPNNHTTHRKITRRYKDLLYRWAPDFATDVVVAAREGSGSVRLRLDMLAFEPELIYACLWYASNVGVEVHVLPSASRSLTNKNHGSR